MFVIFFFEAFFAVVLLLFSFCALRALSVYKYEYLYSCQSLLTVGVFFSFSYYFMPAPRPLFCVLHDIYFLIFFLFVLGTRYRVHTRIISMGLFLVHELTCGKRESVCEQHSMKHRRAVGLLNPMRDKN